MNGRATVEPSTAQALNAFVDRLGDADLPPISRILLYGSQARGDHHEDSDIDVAVVFRDPPPSRYPWRLLHRLTDVAYDVNFRRNFDVYLSPRPVFERQLQDTAATRNPEFHRNILEEGIEWVSGESRVGPR